MLTIDKVFGQKPGKIYREYKMDYTFNMLPMDITIEKLTFMYFHICTHTVVTYTNTYTLLRHTHRERPWPHSHTDTYTIQMHTQTHTPQTQTQKPQTQIHAVQRNTNIYHRHTHWDYRHKHTCIHIDTLRQQIHKTRRHPLLPWDDWGPDSQGN